MASTRRVPYMQSRGYHRLHRSSAFAEPLLVWLHLPPNAKDPRSNEYFFHCHSGAPKRNTQVSIRGKQTLPVCEPLADGWPAASYGSFVESPLCSPIDNPTFSLLLAHRLAVKLAAGILARHRNRFRPKFG
jgi:hypothetical protein